MLVLTVIGDKIVIIFVPVFHKFMLLVGRILMFQSNRTSMTWCWNWMALITSVSH